MTDATQILYDENGNPVSIQMNHEEYVRLKRESEEQESQNARLQEVMRLLLSEGSDEAPVEPAVQEVREASSAVSAGEAPSVDKEERPSPGVVLSAPEETIDSTVEKTVEEISLAAEPVLDAPSGDKMDSVVASEQPAESQYVESVQMPPVLQAFLSEQDPSHRIRQQIEACVFQLSASCGKRITLSLHRPYICLWDFDAWETFAYGEIVGENLYFSIDQSLVQDSAEVDVWTPPSSISKKPLARFRVTDVTERIINQLKVALA